MKIETIGHTDKYSLEQISCLFFNNSEDVEIISEFNEDKEIIETRVKIGEETFLDKYKAASRDIKAFKNSVKKSAYLAMKKASLRETPWGVLTGIRPTKFCRELREKFSYDEIFDILKNDYWVKEDKAAFCVEVTKNSEKIINNISDKDAGVYIGVPFCPSRCSYCSFISESAALYSKFVPEYASALKKEIRETARFSKENGFNITSLYIGGGTPPALGTGLLAEVIDEALKSFSLIACNIEFTVEAGRPDVIDKELLLMLKEKGVNRLCINPQTMNDETLKLIGRNHTSEQTIKAFNLARETGYSNINSDIIAGLPGEDIKLFNNTLKQIEKLSPEGLTVHSMYLKRASRLNKEKSFKDSGEDIHKMIEESIAFAKSRGYRPYYMYKQRSTLGNLENTGYAKEGFESLYNCGIMEEVTNIIAVGAGASSKIINNKNIERVYNIKDAFSYIRDIDEVVNAKILKLRELTASDGKGDN